VTDPRSIDVGIAAAAEAHGGARILVNCAGICPAMRTVGRDRKSGAAVAHDPALFARVVNVNMVGTFNLVAKAAAGMAQLPELGPDKERGVVVLTSSIAAEDGQIGQVAYAASKAGVNGMVLPMARDLAREGIRVVSIMPGLFHTPMLEAIPVEAREALGKNVPFPARLGHTHEYAQLVEAIIANMMLNACSIRLDGGIRMPPM
jgi:NAD(P)-dependent dehydrogenase (short-subunit alcohol dehydrogenase family)